MLQLVGGSLDGHTRAVETEGEDRSLSLEGMITTREHDADKTHRVANSAFVAVKA